MFEGFRENLDDYLISITDSSGKIIHVNKKFCDTTKYSESEILGNSHRLIQSGHHDTEFYKTLWDTLLNGKVWTGFIKNKTKDGTHYWIRSTMIPILDANKKPYQHICISTKLELPTEELLCFADIENIQKALDQSSIVAITDSEGTITYVNKKFCDISKYSKEELIGQNHRILKSGLHPPIFFSQMWATISSGKNWQGDVKNRAKDGTYYWMRTIIMPIFDHAHNTKQFISIRTDVTELYEAKATIIGQFKEIEEEKKVLKELNSLYEKLNKKNSDILDYLNQEIRTPLVIIKSYTEMFLDDKFGAITQIQRDKLVLMSKNIDSLIQSVLDMSEQRHKNN